MSRALVAAVAALAWMSAGVPDAALAQSSPIVCQPVVPCPDPAACPDITVDRRHLAEWYVQEQFFDPLDCTVVEGHVLPGLRLLLRFPTWLSNIGAGTLSLGDPVRRGDLFEWATCHGHFHFRDYAVHRLWRAALYLDWMRLKAAHPEICPAELLRLHSEIGTQVISGFKQGFCLLSLRPVCEPAPPYNPSFSCANQGIDAGWSDVYTADTEGQWIDITSVPPGHYILEIEINSERLIQESNYINNSATIAVEIK